MTTIAIDGEDWLIDGVPTCAGRDHRGWRIEGLLLNSRMANAVFDDDNPYTRSLWGYPDTGNWDAERNTDELIAALPAYRAHGLAAISVNLQGGSPLGYYRAERSASVLEHVRRHHPTAQEDAVWAGVPSVSSQPWNASGFAPDGALKPALAARTARLIENAAGQGMVVILGLFYFGQDERLRDEAAVRRAVDEACGFALDRDLANVVIEIDNECDVPRYEHAILTPPRVHELIEQARAVTRRGRRLLVGTSFTRRMLPTEAVCRVSDFILLHGNGMDDPAEVGARVDAVRAQPGWRAKPIVYNEDDHFDFDRPHNHFTSALSCHASWGYFDPGEAAGGGQFFGNYRDGYQNPPVDWAIGTPRKRAFFALLREVTGA
ncbi:MAG TPA: hypothetical protein VMT79_16340 [Candidatus Binatia bacterium]|nr:hypothetical protein [Candidatus Binatia bacterium]